jgi:hypothetical protein
MSPATSHAQPTDQQSSFLHVPPTRYTDEKHDRFMNGPSLGFVCTQQDIKGPKGIISTRYVSIVSNTNIGNLPAIRALLKETGKQVVEVGVDGDLEAAWAKMDEKTDGRFRETTRIIWELAQQSVLEPWERWEFGNGTDHEKLLGNPSVGIWTMQPRLTGQHSKSSTSGTKSALRLPSDAVVPRRKHYVRSDSDDPPDAVQSGMKSSRGRRTIRDGE